MKLRGKFIWTDGKEAEIDLPDDSPDGKVIKACLEYCRDNWGKIQITPVPYDINRLLNEPKQCSHPYGFMGKPSMCSVCGAFEPKLCPTCGQRWDNHDDRKCGPKEPKEIEPLNITAGMNVTGANLLDIAHKLNEIIKHLNTLSQKEGL